MTSNTIIKNGRIIDPKNYLNTTKNIFISGDKIVDSFKNNTEFEEYDASGCFVVPGLVDMHVHCYEFSTPLGVNADEFSLHRGVTTVVDAGSSGATTFDGFRNFIQIPNKVRFYNFLHISSHGLASAGCSGFGGGGECDSLNQVNVDMCVDKILNNRDLIVGVKIRLSKDVCDEGRNEAEAFRRALSASKQASVPLMVHHTFSSVPTQPEGPIMAKQSADLTNSQHMNVACPGSLEKGDIMTHCYQGYESCIINPATLKIYDSVWEAKRRGVLFDLGHGEGSFSWTTAEICSKENFWPDIISTDLHQGNVKGPAYDLCTVMTKMMHLGFSLEKVISATTYTPAKAIHKEDTIGSLDVGRTADVTVLKLDDCDIEFEDCQGQVRRVRQQIIPVAVFRQGKQVEIKELKHFPNRKKAKESVEKYWDKLLIKDLRKPNY